MDRLKIVRNPKDLATVAELDAICFGENDEFQRFVKKADDFGNMYALWKGETLIGYTVYGQVWLPMNPYAYISSIGVHPEHRQYGWGMKILNAILADLRTNPECLAIHADIRQSNIASQCLFRKAGFYVYCEHDIPYPDEIGLRVVKYLRPMEVSS